jgi:uncharacterized protein YndB with AHSA1/START domain
MTKARAIADIHAGLVLATVDIKAPIDRVFGALTDPNELPKWWGQAEMYQTTAMMADLRPGGEWRTDGVGADGAPFHVGGTYTAVEAPHRVEFTWKPSWEDIETHVSYTLQAIDGGTRVTARHSGFGDHAAACGDHANGWERVLGWLTTYTEGETAPVPAWFVKLKAPRLSFAFDMTPEEAAVMQAHSAYWRAKLATGEVIVFGPVADPAGPFGLGIVRASDTALKAFQDNDPAILSGRGFSYESFPMLSAVTL